MMPCKKCGFKMLEWFVDEGRCPICDEPIPEEKREDHTDHVIERPDGTQLDREGCIELMELEKVDPTLLNGKYFIVGPEGLAEILKRGGLKGGR